MKWNFFVGILTSASFVPLSMFAVIAAFGGLPPFIQFLGFVAVGLLQGALIGFGQALAMRKTVVSVPGRLWIMASTLGAGALWVVGQIPGYFVRIDYSNIVVGIITLLIAAILLAFFGLAQWRVLKHRVRDAYRWIVITVYSWLAGLLVFTLGGMLVRNVTNPLLVTIDLCVFGTVAVIVIAMLSGMGMRVLSRDAIANPRYGTILPNTPRVNAAKRKVASASTRARATGGRAAQKAVAKAAPTVKKAAAKAAPTVKRATSAAKSAVRKKR